MHGYLFGYGICIHSLHQVVCNIWNLICAKNSTFNFEVNHILDMEFDFELYCYRAVCFRFDFDFQFEWLSVWILFDFHFKYIEIWLWTLNLVTITVQFVFDLTWILTFNLMLIFSLNFIVPSLWFWFQIYIKPNQLWILIWFDFAFHVAILVSTEKTTASEESKLKVKVRKADRKKVQLYVPSARHKCDYDYVDNIGNRVLLST